MKLHIFLVKKIIQAFLIFILIFLLVLILYNSLFSVLTQSTYSYGDSGVLIIGILVSAIDSVYFVSIISNAIYLIYFFWNLQFNTIKVFFLLRGRNFKAQQINLIIITFLLIILNVFYKTHVVPVLNHSISKKLHSISSIPVRSVFTPNFFNRLDHNSYLYFENNGDYKYKKFMFFLIKNYHVRYITYSPEVIEKADEFTAKNTSVIRIEEDGKILQAFHKKKTLIDKKVYLNKYARYKENISKRYQINNMSNNERLQYKYFIPFLLNIIIIILFFKKYSIKT